MESKIYKIDYKPYTEKRLSSLARIQYLYIGYLKHILLKFGGKFFKFILYFSLSIPILTAITQLFFAYISNSFTNSVNIKFDSVITSATFPIYFIVSISTSFLITTLTASDYPIFMRYRKMEKGMWLALYLLTLTLFFIPMFFGLLILLIGAVTMFPRDIQFVKELIPFFEYTFRWLIVATISSNIVITFSLIFKKSTFSSILSATYPAIMGILLTIIGETFSISYTQVRYFNPGEIIFNPSAMRMHYLMLNLIIYTLLVVITFIYRRRHAWK